MKNIFSQILFKLTEEDSRIVVITCDVMFPDWELFKSKYPDRFYNLGLTEQTSVGIAAGMASQGLRPIIYTIAPFLLERAFEFLKIDIDENNLPVMLVGYDYENYYGPTHSCLNAKAMIGLFKNIQGYFPKNEQQVEDSMKWAHISNKPSFILLKKI
jgi:transketolase